MHRTSRNILEVSEGLRDARRTERVRHWVQAGTTAVLNGYAAGFARGRIFTGASKRFCVPVLNCYSCPGALGACPVGAAQALLGGGRVPFYVLGTLTIFGVLLGRVLCGFFCPFGLVQDLLYHLPVKKRRVPARLDRPARYGKYVVLLGLVVLAPLLARNRYGVGAPWFCKVLCPAGTLEGGIPLLLANQSLRSLAGALFGWKLLVLLGILSGSAVVGRPFCRYLCPLGAFYALFHRFTLFRVAVDAGTCTRCGACTRVCPMGVAAYADADGGECIRCGKCISACPAGAVSWDFPKGTGEHPPRSADG